MHGSPGMHDGYNNVFSYISNEGIGVIAPSRPGYGRTPLSGGKTTVEAADLYAALLDELKIDQVIVYGISGGGPSAINFALKHPNRCKALVTEVAVTGNFVHPRKAELISFS